MSTSPISYRRLVESARDVIYCCDAGGCITYTNEAGSRLLGYAADEMTGRHVADFVRPDYSDRSRAFYARDLQSVDPATYLELPVITRDGREVWLGQHIQILRSDGEVVGTQAIARDITPRVRAERELKASEERLDLAVQGAGLGLWDWDISSGRIDVNDRWVEALGYGRQAMVLTIDGWKGRIHPDDLSGVERRLNDHLEGRTPLFDAEYRIRKASGDYLYVLDRGRVTERDGDGRPLHFAATHLDITRRKRSERDLVESKNRLQLLYGVIAQRAENIDDQIRETLELSTDLLGMELGVLSRIKDNRYRIDNCHAPGREIEKGDEFALGDTYCSIALDEDDVLVIDRMAESPYQDHSCYDVFGFESYIGIPVWRHDALYGTLCFGSGVPRKERFTLSDRNFMRMLGGWISSALEARQAEDELVASEGKFRSAFDYASIGMAIVRPGGEWVEVNEALCKIVGYSEKELLQLSFQRITHVDDLGKDLELVRRMLSREIETFQLEKRYIHKDGHVVWVLLNVSAVYTADGDVAAFIKQIQDITPQKEMEHRLIRQAQFDSLTGLANRTVFLASLTDQLVARRRNGNADELAVLFLDFDHFKFVNDSLGHSAGDKLLITVAQRMRECLRDDDVIARLGGDEFGVLLPAVTEKSAVEAVADRLQSDLRWPVEIEGYDIYPSASIGVVFDNGEYENPEDILRDADSAMYAAKNAGGAGYSIFSPRMHAEAARRLQLDSELRRAIDNREFIAYYQPIVDLRTGALVGFEALARWQHPSRGIVAPSEFIPHAEEIGLTKFIDRQILDKACDQLHEWRTAFGDVPMLVMHVNCSAQHLLDATLSEIADEVLERSHLDPSSLMLELTESVLIGDVDEAAEQIRRLRSHDIHMCIDDFGTGYSSLNALHALPIDAVKIDRGFVGNMFGEGRRRRMAQTVIDIAQGLDMDVIAEGIETAEQLAELRRLGCAFGQGFLFAKPMPADDAADLIRGEPAWTKYWAPSNDAGDEPMTWRL